MNPSKNTKIIFIISIIVIFISGAFISLYSFGDQSLFQLYSSSENLKNYILSYGTHSEIAYIFIQSLQVVLAPIPGEFTGSLAGFIFGGLKGGILATVGLSIGSLIAFTLGRVIGKPLVSLMVKEEDLQKYAIRSTKKRLTMIFVVFLIPGFPKDVLTYIFSLSNVSYVSFFGASQLGRLPGTILLTFGTAALFEKNWYLVTSIVLVSLAMIIIAFKKKEKILQWLQSE